MLNYQITKNLVLKSLNNNEILEIVSLINESIALNEYDESLFSGMGIRYRLRSNEKLKKIQSLLLKQKSNK